MTTDGGSPTDRSLGDRFRLVVAATIGEGKQVLLLSSPSVVVLLLHPAFDATYHPPLAAALAVLVVYQAGLRLLDPPAEAGTVELLLVGWFYNVVVFGAAVFGTWYRDSLLSVALVLGLPLATVEFRRQVLERQGATSAPDPDRKESA